MLQTPAHYYCSVWVLAHKFVANAALEDELLPGYCGTVTMSSVSFHQWQEEEPAEAVAVAGAVYGGCTDVA